MIWLLGAGCTPDAADPLPPPSPGLTALEDLDPADGRFSGELRAEPTELSFGGQAATAFTYNGAVPGPLLAVDLGDEVAVRFDNALPADFGNTIHWHGIEGYNAADGTPVTQEMVEAGGSFDYTFRATRPGLFWYHPHHRGAQSLFNGLYGPLLVREPAEAELVALGVLPEHEQVLVLSDMSIYDGRVLSAESESAMEVMNGTEGDILLVNGQVRPVFEVPAGDGARLRVLNSSITRFWRLSVPGHALIRVGGQGGLLDRARLEGGTVAGEELDPATGEVVGPAQVDLGFPAGEIVLGPAERADLVLLTDGDPGEDWVLRWEDVARGRHTMAMDGDQMVAVDAPDDGARPGRDVAVLRLVEGSGSGYALAAGDPVLVAVGEAREALVADSGEPDTVPDGVDVDWTGDRRVSLDERMDMWPDADGVWQMETWLGIDGTDWHPEHIGGAGQALAPTAREAALGQLARIEVLSNSRMTHPYHLHGFSFQPLYTVWWPNPEEEGPQGPPVRVWADHVEYVDTITVPGFASTTFAVRFDDPAGDGSAAGRWMEHCHILQHGEHGMASEVVVHP